MKIVNLNRSDVYNGSLILVNASHSFSHWDSKAVMIPISEGAPEVLLEGHTAVLLSRVMEELDGWGKIALVSGWRSHKEQEKIYGDSLEREGLAFTKKYVALPGHSEHETGFAIDLGLVTDQIDFIRPAFPYEGICQRFRERALSYGFIERYPKGKEAVTGIAHEPWHFRYVGAPHGEIMNAHQFTLEEYHDFLKQYPYGCEYVRHGSQHMEMWVSYLAADETGCASFPIPEHIPFTVSGNNVDGFVITQWREQNEK